MRHDLYVHVRRSLTLPTAFAGLFTITQLSFAADKPAPAATATSTRDSSDDKIEIKPYKGDPIFLDEPEAPPASSMVDRVVQSDKYADGKLRIERQIAKYSDNHFVADGFYREYYPNGQKFVEGDYKSGHQAGEWTYWHDNGTVNRRVTFKDGQPDGTWEVHRADGTLAASRSFKQGRRDGTWTIYDDTGKQPLRVESYGDGKADGVWKIWFPNGQMQRQLTFKAGVREGQAIEWDEKGTKRIEMTYVDGKPDGEVNAWTTDGRKVVQHYKDGKLVPEPNQK